MPFSSAKFSDPFEMGDFSPYATPQDLENAIGMLDKKILEMKVSSKGNMFNAFRNINLSK